MITQGENGVAIPFTAYNDGLIDLTGATVEVDVKRADGTTFIKVAEILDAVSGKCQFVLSSTDLSVPGSYEYQWIAYFENGSIKSIRKSDFYVHESLRTTSSGEVSETVLVPFVRKPEFEAVKADVEDLKLIMKLVGMKLILLPSYLTDYIRMMQVKDAYLLYVLAQLNVIIRRYKSSCYIFLVYL